MKAPFRLQKFTNNKICLLTFVYFGHIQLILGDKLLSEFVIPFPARPTG